ncbi:MAG TPA: translational GTPase TypA [Alphaproteobacteria bacterium]|nr:translational GTPase TypA [Alphaproteobacteria bacterium]
MTELRNIAIIAHVDHGKTTLLDNILKQSGTFRENQQVAERVMDSNALEKERGITILAKCTSIEWKDTRINIIDTPGHADFGGEVERILSMVDSVILLVDSSEGPMPQTKFVLYKALKQGLRPIVVVNKADKPEARCEEVIDEIFDLFVSLEASSEQLDFPILYASGRDGWAVEDLSEEKNNLEPLLNRIMAHVPTPKVDENAPFAMLATLLKHDSFMGRILVGKIYSGKIKAGTTVKSLSLKGEVTETARITKLFGHKGIEMVPIEEGVAGDLVCIAGLAKTSVSDTICDQSVTTPLKSTPIDPPTISITLSVNDSPYCGTEGTKVTSSLLRDRLFSEAEQNIAITVKESSGKDAFEVGGRGELQLGVLIENMRREGFELSVSRPRVLMQKDEVGNLLEPIEEVLIDVDDEYSGVVIEKMSLRKADMKDMRSTGGGKTRIIFHAPSRGLIGYQSQFLTDTRGTGIMNRIFHSFAPHKGEITAKRNGALISNDTGTAVAYAIFGLQERGIMFVNPQDKVYTGMIVGENSRDNDLEVNILRGKQLTNVRASGSDEAIRLVPPKKMTLEDMIAYIDDDELVEVTPKSLRLRKRHLDPNDRKRFERSSKTAEG